MKSPRISRLLLAAATLVAASSAHATDGTWTVDAAGNWSDTSNWSATTIADGTDAIASFDTLDLAAARIVTIDTISRTVGTLNFNDTGASGDVAWTLASSGGATLTLAKASGSPTISTGTNATISAEVVGSAGLTKTGSSTLTLSGNNTAFTGAININTGTLLVGNSNALGTGTGAITIAANTNLNVNSGITLAQTGVITMVSSGNAPTGRSTINLTGTATISNNIQLDYSGLTGAGNAFAAVAASGAGVFNGSVTFAASKASTTGANNIFVLRGTGSVAKATGTIDLLTGNSSGLGTLRIVDGGAAWELSGTGNRWTTLDLSSSTGANTQKLYVGATNTLSAEGVLTNTNTTAGSIGTVVLNNIADTTGFNQTVLGIQDGTVGKVAVTSTKAATLTIAGSGTYSSSGIISGSVALNMNSTAGTGVQTLSGNNTYTGGTTITAGTLQVGSTGATNGNVRLNGGNLTISNGVTYNIDGGLTFASNTNAAVSAASGSASIQGNDVWSADIIVNSGVTASIDSSVGLKTNLYGIRIDNTGDLTVAGVITGAGSVAGGVANNGTLIGTDQTALFKLGAGTLTLTGASNFTGGTGKVGATSVQNGTLKLSLGNDRLPTGTAVYLGGSNNTSGILALDGVNQTLTGLTTIGTGTGNAVIGTSATLSTLTVNNTNNYTFSGKLGGVGVNANNLIFVKSGAGVMTLSGVNTYNGGTTINGGAILTGNASALGSGAVTLGGGALQIGATGVTGIASLTVSSGTLDTSAGGVTTTGVFSLVNGTWTIGATADGVTANGGFTLTAGTIDLSLFTNKSTDGIYSLIAGTGTSALTDVNFINGDGSKSYSIDTNGDLVVTAVPEPSTYGLIGAGALAAVAVVRRRRKLAGQAA
jgi:fibronectin-binding autotransporter adhesin